MAGRTLNLIFVIVFLVFGVGCELERNASDSRSAKPTPKTETGRKESAISPDKEANAAVKRVTLTIDAQGDRPLWEKETEWQEGLSVFELLLACAADDEELSVKTRGDGETAFVESIFGLNNDTSLERYWIYHVNDQRGDVGSGVKMLEPGDRVLWKYQAYN